jgi:hypothetical protein
MLLWNAEKAAVTLTEPGRSGFCFTKSGDYTLLLSVNN